MAAGPGAAPRSSALGALTLLLTVAVGAGPASGQTTEPTGKAPASGGGATGGSPATPPTGLTLTSQTAWVPTAVDGDFRLTFTSARTPPAGARVAVTVYQRLTSRSDFNESLLGRIHTSVRHSVTYLLSTLPTQADGSSVVDLPVNPSTVAAGQDFLRLTSAGVYPVDVRLLDGSGQSVARLVTHLLYSGGAVANPRLDVAWVLPVTAPPATSASVPPDRLSPDQTQRLGDLATALTRHPTVPVTLAPTAETLDALTATSAAGRATVSALAQVAARPGVEVAAGPYVALNLPAQLAAGLDGEVTAQLTQASASLAATLHVRPGLGTWVQQGPLDQASVDDLAARGVDRLVVNDASLTALPADQLSTTLAQPFSLQSRQGRTTALAADTAMAAHFVAGGNQVLAAHQMLADLAIIQAERPANRRGVTVLTPAGWRPDPAFLQTVLDGLSTSPVLAPVTVDQLFAAVPPAQDHQAPLQRAVAAQVPAGPAVEGSAVRAARRRLDAFATMTPTGSTVSADAARRLLLSQSADLSAGAQADEIGTVNGLIDQQIRGIRLTPNTSIRLTARQGRFPVTIVNGADFPARVQVRLSSQKLEFRPIDEPGVTCRAAGSSETCTLDLRTQNTTLKVPVVTRTSGVFSLTIRLTSPDGGLALATSEDTMRSTAASGVGIVLSIGAALLLAMWWVRDLRHGRRARDLVPAAVEPDADEAEFAVLVHSGPAGQDAQPAGVPRAGPEPATAAGSGNGGRPARPDLLSAADPPAADPDPDPDPLVDLRAGRDEWTELPAGWVVAQPAARQVSVAERAPVDPPHPLASPAAPLGPGPTGHDNGHPPVPLPTVNERRDPPAGRVEPGSTTPPVAVPIAGDNGSPPLPPVPAGAGGDDPGQPPPPVAPRAAGDAEAATFSRNTAIVAGGTLLSRLTGFLRVLALVYAFRVSRLADIYNLANTAPNILYDLVLGGILSATLVPVFVDWFGRGDEEGWRAVSAVVTVITVTLATLTVLFWLVAPVLIRFYLVLDHGPGAADERALGTTLLRLFAPQLFLLGGIALTTALLNARRHFLAPAFSPVLNNLVIIAAIVAAREVATSLTISAFDRDTLAVLILGLGTTAGYLVQLVAQLPALFQGGMRLRPVWDLHHPAVRTVLRLSLWTFGSVIANQISLNLILVVAARKPGDVTVFQTAFQFFQLPYAIFAVSIAAVLTPDLSDRWARGDVGGFRRQLAGGLRLTLAVVVPGAVGYVLLARPAITLLVHHGGVGSSSAHQIGNVVALFAVGLPGFSAYLLLMRAYQAMQNARSMFWLYVFENGLTVVLALALYPALGVGGLALGWVLAYTFGTIAAFADLRRRTHGLEGRRTLSALGRITVGQRGDDRGGRAHPERRRWIVAAARRPGGAGRRRRRRGVPAGGPGARPVRAEPAGRPAETGRVSRPGTAPGPAGAADVTVGPPAGSKPHHPAPGRQDGDAGAGSLTGVSDRPAKGRYARHPCGDRQRMRPGARGARRA